jgi:hypothetical protein
MAMVMFFRARAVVALVAATAAVAEPGWRPFSH